MVARHVCRPADRFPPHSYAGSARRVMIHFPVLQVLTPARFSIIVVAHVASFAINAPNRQLTPARSSAPIFQSAPCRRSAPPAIIRRRGARSKVPAIRANTAALRRAPSAYRVALYLASIMGIFPHICITSTQTHSAGALCSEISANRPCAALLFGVSAFTIFVVRGWKLGSLQDAQWVVLHLATFSGIANFRGSFRSVYDNF